MGRAINPYGFTRTPVPGHRGLWQFKLAEIYPWMFLNDNGVYIQPDNRIYTTDAGSIPWPINKIPGYERTRFFAEFSVHDSGYKNRARWLSYDGIEFTRAPARRAVVDWDLYLHVSANPDGTEPEARKMYNALRVFGWLAWWSNARKRTDDAGKAIVREEQDGHA